MSNNQLDDLKEPLYSFESEQAVLSGLITENSLLDDVSEIIEESDFYNYEHRVIYSAIVELSESYKSFDVITLSEYLHTHGLLDYTDSLRCLGGLAKNTSHFKYIKINAKIIREYAYQRKIIAVLTNITQSVYIPNGRTMEELLDMAESQIYEISERLGRSKSYEKIQDLLVSEVDRIDTLYQNDKKYTGIPSGYDDFDYMTSGFQKSDLIILAGRPAMGKTSFAINIIENVAIKQNLPVAFFDINDSSQNIVRKIISSQSKISIHKLSSGNLVDEDWPDLTSAVGALNEAPIFINDTPGLNPIEIRSCARAIHRQHRLSMIVIDYLQLIQSVRDKSESRTIEISKICCSLKGLAKELGVPVIVLSQLKPGLEERPNRRPMLSDLPDASAIEEYADQIIFLYRDEVYNELSPDKGTAEIIFCKNKNGPVGTSRLTFLEKYAHFENLINHKFRE